MKKAAPKHPTTAEKKRVVALVEKWRGLLFLNGWRISVEWSPVPDKDEEETHAEIDVFYPYMNARITIYPRFWSSPGNDPDEQERKIVHELCHCLTRRMKGLAHDLLSEKLVVWREVKEHDEHLTDWVANVVYAMWTMKGRGQ